MKLIAIILLMWYIIQMTESKKTGYFTHLECPAPYKDIVNGYTCSLVKNADGIPVVNVNFKLKEDVSHATMHIKIKAKQGTKDEETMLVFDLNVCDSLETEHDHFFVNMIFKELRRVSNIPSRCPLKKDIAYTIQGFSIDSSVIPTYLPELSWSALTYFNISNEKAVTFNAYGKLSEKIEVTL